MKRWAKWFIPGLVLACVAMVGYAIGMTRAEGIPATEALTYSGLLEDISGTPLAGNKNIQLALWDSESGGNKLCETLSQSIALINGRFEVVLPDACVDQVKANFDTWVEVTVNGAPLERAKIGAVPYAVEAAHAASASSAAGALEQRISALENQAGGQTNSQISGHVAGIWFRAGQECATTPQTLSWTDIPETTVSFTVTRPVKIFTTYSINIQPEGNPGNEYLVTHLTVDGTVAEPSASHFHPLTGGDSNVNINGNYVTDLEAGSHTVTMQWVRAVAIGEPTHTWSNCPTWTASGASTAGRTVVVMAVYK
jgi:hypothetical protein